MMRKYLPFLEMAVVFMGFPIFSGNPGSFSVAYSSAPCWSTSYLSPHCQLTTLCRQDLSTLSGPLLSVSILVAFPSIVLSRCFCQGFPLAFHVICSLNQRQLCHFASSRDTRHSACRAQRLFLCRPGYASRVLPSHQTIVLTGAGTILLPQVFLETALLIPCAM